MIRNFWNSLGSASRAGLVAGAAAVVLVTVGAAAWLWRADYQVLFADLKPQDASTMAAELDRMKVPYRIGGDGTTILVDAPVLHATRLKLMGKDLPLHGAAGFELFNNADFGMTEFAQKINYQRALQGEITRTILSLSEVRDARVHLALAEEGLFKRATSKAKAAITLSLKAGQALRPEQISGIQRLVSAAVPGINPQDVTIVDQQGVALSRPVQADGDQDIGTARLDLKRDTEKLLARKAMEVLESAFGTGQAMATVDVTLNMDHVRVTTEEVLGSPARSGQASSGVIVRERESTRDLGAPLSANGEANRTNNSQREVEYQVGRRTEHLASQPGAIRRLQIVAVIRQPLTDEQSDRIRVLVGAAVGAVPERGDHIVIHGMKAADPAVMHDQVASLQLPTRREAGSAPPQTGFETTAASAAFGVLALAAFTALGAWALRRVRPRDRAMSPSERQATLEQVHTWLDGPPPGRDLFSVGQTPGPGAKA